MQTITVRTGQTNLDIALMAFGNVGRVLELPNLIDSSLTDDLISGTVIKNIPEANSKDLTIAKLMRDVRFVPASGKNVVALGGIGYMEIGNDFKVS